MKQITLPDDFTDSVMINLPDTWGEVEVCECHDSYQCDYHGELHDLDVDRERDCEL